MNSYHVIKGCKDSSNSTLVRASNAVRRLPPAVVSGPSSEAFKRSLAGDGTVVLALSYDAGLEQEFTNTAPRARAKRTA